MYNITVCTYIQSYRYWHDKVTHLQLHQATIVGLEVRKVDLSHGVHIVRADLVSCIAMVCHQEFIVVPDDGTKQRAQHCGTTCRTIPLQILFRYLPTEHWKCLSSICTKR